MTIAVTPPDRSRLPLGGTDMQARIAAAAIELFFTRGSAATTVRDITAACGLTPGALYNHFASKDQLLYVLVRDVHLQTDEQFAAVVAGAGDNPGSQLAAGVRYLVGQSASRRQQSRVANREFSTLSADRRHEIVAIRRRMRGRLTAVVEAGLRSGMFAPIGAGGLPSGAEHRERADAALLANAIAVMCVNISDWTSRSHEISVAELQDSYVRIALRLVGAAS
jgi:TetR/AcrR family transcriptional regulator, cholesterol catabolism regulator